MSPSLKRASSARDRPLMGASKRSTVTAGVGDEPRSSEPQPKLVKPAPMQMAVRAAQLNLQIIRVIYSEAGDPSSAAPAIANAR